MMALVDDQLSVCNIHVKGGSDWPMVILQRNMQLYTPKWYGLCS